ncbi:Translation elongation factor EF1B/ribosomal protein S6 [Moorella glycerini]|uniref:NPCBM/NEW2 domain protein n=1 Tax=Neomoorella stamsii TaxID=1266720 RepID=A0A9X7P7L8_9FIRM|nr:MULTISPECIES: type 4a pilus biogenesis protein PilO [Moorella]PRR77740.1 NPCBM/NEW2 domain protein [Moorella stamsii]CEP66043.1 Translation elongation factor EF1B/ribosomal protein S6 [Moorella glycerini]
MKFGTYQFNRREKILLVLLAVVVGIIFFNKVVLGQQLPAYRELRGRLKAGQERLAAARQAAASAAELAKKADQARAAWEAARLHLGFTLRGTAPFLEAAQPRDQSLQVLAFRPLPVEKRDPFRVYPYEVTVSGPYPALQDYISQLESLPALTAIHNLKILARQGNAAAVEASFIIDLYDLGEGNPVPGAIALFPAGRADGFTPPAKVVAGGDGAKGAGASPGQGEAAGSKSAGSSTPAASGPVPANLPPSTKSSPPAGNPATAPGTQPVLSPLATNGEPHQYTFPRQVQGRLVPGPAFQEPPAGEGDVWLEELRVLRNVGPFFVLDRPAALAGMNLGRSIGVTLSKDKTKAELKVDLRGRYTRLQGYTGIDDSFANSSGKVKVTIFADGRQLYQGEIRPGDYPQYLELPLFLVQQLTFSLEWQAGGIGDYDQLLATLASLHFSRRD